MELTVDVLWASLRKIHSSVLIQKALALHQKIGMSVHFYVLSQNKRFQAWLGISITNFTYGLATESMALNRYKEKGHCVLSNLSSFAPIEWADSFPVPM